MQKTGGRMEEEERRGCDDPGDGSGGCGNAGEEMKGERERGPKTNRDGGEKAVVGGSLGSLGA